MKRLLLFLISYLLFLISYSQEDTTLYQKFPNSYGPQYKDIWATRTLRLPDTSFKPMAGAPGAVARDAASSSLYLWDGGQWIPVSGISGGGGACPNGLIQPGYVTWSGTGLTFNVTAAIYGINCKIYNSAAGSITLDPADPTNPRTDVIGLDTNGNIIKITGIPSPSPSVPQIDPASQLALTVIDLHAGATTPSILQQVIYDENTEPFTHLVTSGLTVNFDNTVNPYHLAKSMDVGSAITTKNIDFTRGAGTDTASKYTMLNIYVRLKDTLGSNGNLRVSFLNGNTAVSNAIIFVAGNGFNRRYMSGYQNIIVPISAFTFTSTTFNKVRLQLTGTTNGFYADYFQLQSGVAPPATIETDPIATQKTITVNGVTQKLNDNPVFTVNATGVETDPLSVHLTDSAAMLAPYLRFNIAAATYQPKGNYLTSESDPLALAKTITVNGNTQALNTNPSFTIPTGTSLNGNGFVKMAGTTPSYIPQISLTTDVAGLLPIANGGTGTATPGIVAGTGITISGSWPNQTVNATGTSSAWNLTGNTLLNRTTNYLGSSDTSQVHIKTKATDAIVIDSNQNIGIGTGAPANRLEISRSISGASGGLYAQITNPFDSRHIKVGVFYFNSYGTLPGIWLNQAGPSQTNYTLMADINGDNLFNTPSGSTMRFRFNNTDKFTITGTAATFFSTNVVVSNGTISSAGRIIAVTTTSGNLTLTANNEVVIINASTGPVTITVPNAVGNKGSVFTIKKYDNSANAVTITSVSNIDNVSTSYTLSTQNKYVTITSDNNAWYIIANN